MKKTLISCVVLVGIFANILMPCALAGSYANSESESVNAMTCIFNYWDAYTDQYSGDYNPPEYFGGFVIGDDGGLTVCITDDTEEVRNEIMSDCKSVELEYQLVTYSFMELFALQENILNSKSSETVTTTISIPNNSVNVYCEEPSVLYSSNAPDASTFDHPAVEIFVYNTQESIIETTHNISVLLNNEADLGHSISDETSEVDSAKATTTSFYPGQTAHPMGESGIGTIGFAATDSSGKKILITHGHTYADELDKSKEYTDCLYATFGTDETEFPVYVLSTSGNLNEMGSVTDYLDAAYIPVTGTITNVMPNGEKLTSAVYSTQMSSVSNLNANYYGSTNKTVTGTITVSGESNSNYTIIMNCTAASSRTGDSGGPIYLTDGNVNKLVGIVRAESGSNFVYGVTWTAIANAYSTCLGKSITVKLT